jgi:hypothetical protein
LGQKKIWSRALQIGAPFIPQKSGDGMDRQAGQVFAQYPEINRFGKAGIATGLPNALQFLEGSQARDGGNRHVGQVALLARPVD